jgi:hypothetical protein
VDKKSEQTKDAKAWGDTDVGIHEYGPGNKRQQLDGLWGFTTITGGSREQRLVNQNYCKDKHAAYDKNPGDPNHTIGQTLERIQTTGGARENTSQPRIVAVGGMVGGKL